MADRLKGKVALISGAASGIGAAQAKVFAAEGAQVVLGDVQEDAGQAVADAIVADGGDAAFVPLDVTDLDRWSQVVAHTVERYGKLTTLLNTAGIFHPGGVAGETPDGWARMIEGNQTGVFYGMQAAVPELRKTGNAAIVNIASIYALMGSENAIAYHASKGAIRIMGKAAALEFVGDGIRVNTIFPGQIQTPILGGLTPEMDRAIKAAIPMGRMGEPEDIAYGALYLASDEAKYVSGAELCIDGAWRAK